MVLEGSIPGVDAGCAAVAALHSIEAAAHAVRRSPPHERQRVPDLELIEIVYDDGMIDASISVVVVLVAIAIIVVVAWVVARGLPWSPRLRPVQVTIPFGPWGTLTLERNDDIVRLAHEAWVEISTRKCGLPFDRDHDVIVEVYDSYYALFGELRRIARSVPAETLRTSTDARLLVDILVSAANDGLRPHLTTYQARFRSWYSAERVDRAADEPQRVQRDYANYDRLVSDIEIVQQRMTAFAVELHDIVHGRESSSGRPS